jgi:hypothetical protein
MRLKINLSGSSAYDVKGAAPDCSSLRRTFVIVAKSIFCADHRLLLLPMCWTAAVGAHQPLVLL